MLCNASDSTSRCARGCEQTVSKRDVSVRGSGSKQYLMTQGPMKRRDVLEENALEGTVGMFLFCFVLFCFVLFLFCFVLFLFVLFLFCFVFVVVYVWGDFYKARNVCAK